LSALNRFARKKRVVGLLFTAGPGVIWLVVFLLLPSIFVLSTSFLSRGDYGQVQQPWTFENYKRLAGFGLFGFDTLYPKILWRSFVTGALTTLLTAITACPLAFFIASRKSGFKVLALVLVVIPFWTNLLVRTYAWQLLLEPGGLLGRLAASLHLSIPGQSLYPSWFAVYGCLICDYLPFMALPLYASVEKIDWTMAEAAFDLGANRWQMFRHALFPQIKPGLIAGAILVFLPATGQFVISDLLGGAKTVLLGNLLQQQFGASRDWPFGSALTLVAMLVVIGGLVVARRLLPEREVDLI